MYDSTYRQVAAVCKAQSIRSDVLARPVGSCHSGGRGTILPGGEWMWLVAL